MDNRRVVEVVMRAVDVATVGFAETSATTMPVPWAISTGPEPVSTDMSINWPAVWRHISVSYTHLTLPTICSV